MNYREQRAYLNCEKRVFDGVGEFDIPEIKPVDVDLDGAELIGFNQALTTTKPENKIVHFYVDDYQFERVWSSPERYLELLSRFRAVLSPDFSMYTDFPKAVSLFNHYRKQWCGAFWQDNGVTVIPTACWVEESSYPWCFDGMPKKALVSVSTIGASKNPEARKVFIAGWKQMIKELEPAKILLVGKKFPWIDYPDDKLVVYQSPNLVQKEEKSKRGA